MTKLSIIIPCYNAEPYIHELLDCLDKQVNRQVEVLVIDDGSKVPFKTEYKWCRVIRQRNRGASVARNVGIGHTTGQYIAFIDADDMVSDRYVETILDKIDKESPDYIYLSWQTLPGGWQCDVKLSDVSDNFPSFNLCVWNRVYKRNNIGRVRFNENKKIAEDAEFIRKVRETGRKAIISDYMYFYRSSTPDSLTKRFNDGRLDTQRIVYHYEHVTSDMNWLIDEFKAKDEIGEVILMTEKNELPELENYAMVIKPAAIRGTEFHGEPTSFFTQISTPIRTQVVIWTARTEDIGGIETFIYNFCTWMKDYYDILVLYDQISQIQLARLRKSVRCLKNDANRSIICDSLIINRITDVAPPNVKYGQKIQMCHTCRIVDSWTVPQDNDKTVFVSQVAKKSYGVRRGMVINNLTHPDNAPDGEDLLILVSATRLGTFEKGRDRMERFAKLLNDNGIEFVWFCFSDVPPIQTFKGMVWMKPQLNILPYVRRADYLVQLSDSESFGYSIVEALEVGTPVITTPIPVLDEIGFIDGVHGHVVPYDMEGIDLSVFKSKLDFEYVYDNEKRVRQWRSILGNTKPTHDYDPNRMKTVRVIREYNDIALNEVLSAGTVLDMPDDRADYLANELKFVEILNG